MTTNVYIDGFNLYYGAVKDTPYRWLNLAELCRILLPTDQINRIKYFTARVMALPGDPDSPSRQSAYLRALETIPNLEIFYGHFRSHKRRRPLADGSGLVEILETTEKGSDVALGAHLVHDAHMCDYDTAVILSTDSDLLPPIRIVRQDIGKKVGLLCPHKRFSPEHAKEFDFFSRIRPRVLRASQFPDVLTDSTGDFHKPASW